MKQTFAIKRTLSAALLAAACLFSAACAQSDAPQSSQESSGDSKPYGDLTDKPVTLTVWESANGPDTWIKKAGEEFNKLYPNIKIEFYNVEVDVALDNELKNHESTAPAPDLFGSPHDKLGELVSGGYVLPVSDPDYVQLETLKMASQGMTYDGVIYGYPTSSETYALFYNKALVTEDKIPKTWDDVISWSESFNKSFTGRYGFVFHCDTVYYNVMLMSRDNNRIMQGNATGLLSDSALYGMQLLQRMAAIFPEAIAESDYNTVDSLFLDGNAAMIINGPWFIPSAKEAKIDFGVTTLPAFTADGDPSLSFSGIRGMFVSSKTEHPDEANAFAKFLISEEMQKLRFDITGALPSVNIAVTDEIASAFIDQLSYAYPMPNNANVAAFWEYGTDFSKNILGGADAAEELKKYDDYIMNKNRGADIGG